VSLSAPMDCVVPLGKGITRAGPKSAANAVGLPCKARLAMNADKLTEYDNITLIGHFSLRSWQVCSRGIRQFAVVLSVGR